MEIMEKIISVRAEIIYAMQPSKKNPFDYNNVT